MRRAHFFSQNFRMNKIQDLILSSCNPVKTTVATDISAGTTSHSLCLCHYAQQILTKNLPDISFAVTTLK